VKRFAPTALMFGNFVTGMSVLAPAGMLGELSAGLGVTIPEAGLLITFGAVVLCVGSPATAWLTSRIDRRPLLSVTLLVIALGHLASALAPNYATLMAARLVMLAVAALFTPQAAGAASLIAPPEKRGSTMTYVFLGWSLAAAVGLPMVTFLASHLGWRVAYGAVAACAFASFGLAAWRLPAGLAGVPVELRTWGLLARNPLLVMLLSVTALQLSGQFTILTFLAPLVPRLTSAGPETVALLFAIYGAMGFAGNVIASYVVDSWGAWKTSLMFSASLLVGIGGWALGAGVLPAMLAAMTFWGFGFAATNSMQQVRLVAAAPPLSSASVSLNTSMIYVGQGVGSAVGGMFYVREAFGMMNAVAVAFIVSAITLIVLTRPRAGGH
jgi:predicted MFS family arabinose efflux permease